MCSNKERPVFASCMFSRFNRSRKALSCRTMDFRFDRMFLGVTLEMTDGALVISLEEAKGDSCMLLKFVVGRRNGIFGNLYIDGIG